MNPLVMKETKTQFAESLNEQIDSAMRANDSISEEGEKKHRFAKLFNGSRNDYRFAQISLENYNL